MRSESAAVVAERQAEMFEGGGVGRLQSHSALHFFTQGIFFLSRDVGASRMRAI